MKPSSCKRFQILVIDGQFGEIPGEFHLVDIFLARNPLPVHFHFLLIGDANLRWQVHRFYRIQKSFWHIHPVLPDGVPGTTLPTTSLKIIAHKQINYSINSFSFLTLLCNLSLFIFSNLLLFTFCYWISLNKLKKWIIWCIMRVIAFFYLSILGLLFSSPLMIMGMASILLLHLYLCINFDFSFIYCKLPLFSNIPECLRIVSFFLICIYPSLNQLFATCIAMQLR